MSMNLDQARRNMIANQVRPWDVLDPAVLAMLAHVHREDFVPQAWRNLAFADLSLPLGHGEVMMKPVVEGRLLQALELDVTETVLEIGTGSGYLSACMATMASHVTSVELYSEFTDRARGNLTGAGIDNVSLTTADAWHDYQTDASFDVVVVTGAVETVPDRFLSWLKPGGRAFFVIGRAPIMRAILIHRQSERAWREQSLFETELPYLVHAAPPPTFVF